MERAGTDGTNAPALASLRLQGRVRVGQAKGGTRFQPMANGFRTLDAQLNHAQKNSLIRLGFFGADRFNLFFQGGDGRGDFIGQLFPTAFQGNATAVVQLF